VQAVAQQAALAGAVEDRGEFAAMASMRSKALASTRKSTSSSGKSRVASTSMRRSMRRSHRPRTSVEKLPVRERTAERAAAAVEASMRSATLSAWARSSLPLRKARRVNSPGSARRAPSSRQRASSICMTTGPPWPWSSMTSSPVKEWGAGK
jgi:hypothetical protein